MTRPPRPWPIYSDLSGVCYLGEDSGAFETEAAALVRLIELLKARQEMNTLFMRLARRRLKHARKGYVDAQLARSG